MDFLRSTPPLALLLALAIPPPGLQGQETGTVVGTVLDEATQAPLFGAIVAGTDEQFSTVTNQDGQFSIRGLPPGEVPLRIQHPAHVSVVEQVTVTSGEATFVQFHLSAVAFVLDQLKVTAERNPNQDEGSSYSQMEPTLSESALTAMDLLQARFPSLSIRGGDRNAGADKQVLIRGIGSIYGGNTPSLYVDGVRAEISFLSNLPSSEVRSIRVLRGPAAAGMYAYGANGVIIVETRSTPPGGPGGGGG